MELLNCSTGRKTYHESKLSRIDCRLQKNIYIYLSLHEVFFGFCYRQQSGRAGNTSSGCKGRLVFVWQQDPKKGDEIDSFP